MSAQPNFVERSLLLLKAWWPISLIALMLTFMSQLGTVVEYSKYLHAFLVQWRTILHGFVQFPVNLVLSIFDFKIEITSPIPEYVFTIWLAVLSVKNNDKFIKLYEANGNVVRFLFFPLQFTFGTLVDLLGEQRKWIYFLLSNLIVMLTVSYLIFYVVVMFLIVPVVEGNGFAATLSYFLVCLAFAILIFSRLAFSKNRVLRRIGKVIAFGYGIRLIYLCDLIVSIVLLSVSVILIDRVLVEILPELVHFKDNALR